MEGWRNNTLDKILDKREKNKVGKRKKKIILTFKRIIEILTFE